MRRGTTLRLRSTAPRAGILYLKTKGDPRGNVRKRGQKMGVLRQFFAISGQFKAVLGMFFKLGPGRMRNGFMSQKQITRVSGGKPGQREAQGSGNNGNVGERTRNGGEHVPRIAFFWKKNTPERVINRPVACTGCVWGGNCQRGHIWGLRPSRTSRHILTVCLFAQDTYIKNTVILFFSNL